MAKGPKQFAVEFVAKASGWSQSKREAISAVEQTASAAEKTATRFQRSQAVMEKAATGAARSVEQARERQADAAAKAEIAEKKLAEATKKYGDGSSKAAEAELRLVQARRSSAGAAGAVTKAIEAQETVQRRLADATANVARESERSATQMGRFRGSLSDLGDRAHGIAVGGLARLKSALGDLTRLAGVAAAGAAAGIGVGMLKMVDLAGRAEQSVGGVQAVFGTYSDVIVRESKKAADGFGLSATAYQELATTMGATLKNKGVKDYGVQTQKLVALGGDLAATYGGTAKQAVEALGSAMRGESDPIEKYGVSLGDAAVKAKLAEMGITGVATEAEKTQARLLLVMEQTSAAQGQAASEHDTYAASLERVKAQASNAAAELGEALLPAATLLLDQFSASLPQIKDWAEKGLGHVTDFVAGLTGSGGEAELGKWGVKGQEFRDKLDSIKTWWDTDGDQVVADALTLAAAVEKMAKAAGEFAQGLRDADAFAKKWNPSTQGTELRKKLGWGAEAPPATGAGAGAGGSGGGSWGGGATSDEMTPPIVLWWRERATAEGQKIGTEITNGISQGVDEGMTTTKPVTDGAWSRFWQGTKDFFGIKSPSTLFAEVGGNVSQGFADGVGSRLPTILTDFDTWFTTLNANAGVRWAELRDQSQLRLDELREGASQRAGEMVELMGRAWDRLPERFKQPVRDLVGWLNRNLISGVNTIASKVGLGDKWLGDIPTPMANGGITRDPQVTNRPILWGEAGPEAYIPLSPNKRSRSLALWQQVGRELGATTMANGAVFPLPAGSYYQTQGVHGVDRGYDYGAPSGTPVRANANATVVRATDLGNRSYGKYVQLSNGSIYAHLSSIAVSAGQQVAAGQLLGGVGSTGKSTGNHLHYVPGGSGILGAIMGALDIGKLFSDQLGDIAGKAGAALSGTDFGAMLSRIPGKLAEGALKTLKDKALSAIDSGIGMVQSGGNFALAGAMAAGRGWSPANTAALLWLIQKESGGRVNATNPTSGAYGIPQALPGSKMASAGADWRTNPRTQISWMLGYIEDRFGTATQAKAFHQANNWYDGGGRLRQGTSWVTNHSGADELILNGPQERVVADALGLIRGARTDRATTSGTTAGGPTVDEMASAFLRALNASDRTVVRKRDLSRMGAPL